MQRIIKAGEKAANGDTAAAKIVLQYTLGEPESLDLIQTIARLEFTREDHMRSLRNRVEALEKAIEQATAAEDIRVQLICCSSRAEELAESNAYDMAHPEPPRSASPGRVRIVQIPAIMGGAPQTTWRALAARNRKHIKKRAKPIAHISAMAAYASMQSPQLRQLALTPRRASSTTFSSLATIAATVPTIPVP